MKCTECAGFNSVSKACFQSMSIVGTACRTYILHVYCIIFLRRKKKYLVRAENGLPHAVQIVVLLFQMAKSLNILYTSIWSPIIAREFYACHASDFWSIIEPQMFVNKIRKFLIVHKNKIRSDQYAEKVFRFIPICFSFHPNEYHAR